MLRSFIHREFIARQNRRLRASEMAGNIITFQLAHYVAGSHEFVPDRSEECIEIRHFILPPPLPSYYYYSHSSHPAAMELDDIVSDRDDIDGDIVIEDADDIDDGALALASGDQNVDDADDDDSDDDDDYNTNDADTSNDPDAECNYDDDGNDEAAWDSIREILHIFDALFHGFSDEQIAAMLDDDREDWDDLNDLRLILNHRKRLRKVRWQHIRKDLTYLQSMLSHTNEFSKLYRMEEEHYEYLLDHLRDDLAIDELQSMRSTSGGEPITPERIVLASLEHIGEGSTPRSLAHSYGVSPSSMEVMIKKFTNAVIYNTSCDELQISLPDPNNPKELRDLSERWAEVSTVFQLFNGYLGSLDGWLPRTEMPFDVNNQTDYFSGHYQCYGINIQAMCDPDLVFLFASAAAPGKVNDNRAFKRCGNLVQWLDDLPDKYFIGGDNAYPLSRKLLIPFNGAEANNEHHRTYNFYLSQLRVRIEMAFGLLTTKWRILRTTLRRSCANNTKMILLCMKLHNFCIRMKQRDGWKLGKLAQSRANLAVLGGIDRQLGGCIDRELGVIDREECDDRCNRFGYMPTVQEEDNNDEEEGVDGALFMDVDGEDDSIVQANNSHRCDMVREIYIYGIKRPMHNKRRNARAFNDEMETSDDEYDEEEMDEDHVEGCF